jgi:Autotransporter beta-domain
MPIVLRATRRPGLPKLALTATAIVVAAGRPAFATTEMDCAAIAREALEVDLTIAASDTRYIALRSGEVLRFAFEAESGPFGTLTLIEGAGSPRVLLVGPSGTAVSFTARREGAFGFKFAREGEFAARFTVACGPSKGAPGRGAAAKGPALGHGTLPLDSDAIEELQVAGLDETLSSEDLSVLAKKGVGLAARNGAAAASNVGTDAHMKLQWLDQRHRAAGAGGSQVDPKASGVEIGFNYKLQSAATIGALAQVNPAEEMLLGSQRSVVDQGWMAGPFTTIQLAPGLVLDARAAWGEGATGPVEALASAAQRHQVSARVANENAFGAWRFTPSVNFSYLQESLPGSGPATEAGHATAAGRIDVGPELAYRTDLTSSTFVEPRVVVGGFWNLDSLPTEAAGGTNHAEMRLKAEAGVTFGLYNGPKLQALGGLEEGGPETPDAWSGRLQLSVPLK